MSLNGADCTSGALEGWFLRLVHYCVLKNKKQLGGEPRCPKILLYVPRRTGLAAPLCRGAHSRASPLPVQ
ncbi:hypothetical protein BRAS3843_530048 [Bradyrhizobium sp. STM 3843]|nr:hypothetical protein BRAS3843_530048 [Bradyrhizobium sp. STM 3843]